MSQVNPKEKYLDVTGKAVSYPVTKYESGTLFYATAGGVVFTLPDSGSDADVVGCVLDFDYQGYVTEITIAGADAVTYRDIDGDSIFLNNPGESVRLLCVSAGVWLVVGLKGCPMLDEQPLVEWGVYGGVMTKVTLDIAPSDGAADYAFQAFVYTGLVHIKKLYAVINDTTEVTVMSEAGLSLFDADDWAVLTDITAHVLDLSGTIVGDKVIRNKGDVSKDCVLVSGLGTESDAGNILFGELYANAKVGAVNTIQFLVTLGVATDAEITWYCEWVPLTEGSGVVAGDGSIHKFVVS